MKKNKINNVLFKEKLYKFLIDEENKRAIITLVNLLLLLIFINIFKSQIILTMIFYLAASIVINKNYLKLINKLFGKKTERLNNYF